MWSSTEAELTQQFSVELTKMKQSNSPAMESEPVTVNKEKLANHEELEKEESVFPLWWAMLKD